MEEPGFRGDRRFKDPRQIGIGLGCEVYKCTDTKSNSIVAVKHFRINNQEYGFPLRGVSVLKKLDHPNIVRLIDEIYDEDGAKVVLECLHCSLDSYASQVKPIDPHFRKRFLFQTLEGVSYLHSKNIVHGHLNSRNLLIDHRNKIVKIGGFDYYGEPPAVPENSYSVPDYCYKPPEVVLNMPGQDSSPVDIWAVGCIFAVLLRGANPFTGPYNSVLLMMIWLSGVPKEEEWEGVTEAYSKTYLFRKEEPPRKYQLSRLFKDLEPLALDLLEKLLCFQPHRRITASDALKHPYFNDLHEYR